MPCSSGIISGMLLELCGMLLEIHTMNKCDFLKSIIHCQII